MATTSTIPVETGRMSALAYVIMGGAHIRNGHLFKGFAYLLIQLLLIVNIQSLAAALKGLITLGEVAQQRKGFDIIQGDHSIHMLVEGVGALMIVAVVVFFYWLNIRTAKHLRRTDKSIRAQIVEFYEDNFAFLALSPAAVLALAFVILPIIITVAVSFTNYAAPNNIPPRNLVDWVGFRNFAAIVELDIWSGTFVGVAIWTVTWAFFSTVCTVAFGFMLALALSKKEIIGKSVWRLIFLLPYAIPVFVTLLVFRLMLNGVGPINGILNGWGYESIPFLSHPVLAKITVIALSVWAGAPYFMLMIAGAMTNIPSDIYEAAEVDGANAFSKFYEITLPMVLNQIAPSLVMTFAFNFNNFGAVYLLTEGGPINPEYRFAGHTDILITWIYKLTLDFQQYHIASVVSIVIFLFLSTIAIWQFRRMQSFKQDVGA